VKQRRIPLPAAAFHPAFWLAAFVAWFATLWWLSSRQRPMDFGPPIPFLDKILHFGWFFGGAGLLCAFLHTLRPAAARGSGAFLLIVGLLAAIGALDEWHQSWVPGRSGLSPGDWVADILGTIAGVWCFRHSGRHLLSR
jgi:VanZ family protein